MNRSAVPTAYDYQLSGDARKQGGIKSSKGSITGIKMWGKKEASAEPDASKRRESSITSTLRRGSLREQSPSDDATATQIDLLKRENERLSAGLEELRETVRVQEERYQVFARSLSEMHREIKSLKKKALESGPPENTDQGSARVQDPRDQQQRMQQPPTPSVSPLPSRSSAARQEQHARTDSLVKVQHRPQPPAPTRTEGVDRIQLPVDYPAPPDYDHRYVPTPSPKDELSRSHVFPEPSGLHILWVIPDKWAPSPTNTQSLASQFTDLKRQAIKAFQTQSWWTNSTSLETVVMSGSGNVQDWIDRRHGGMTVVVYASYAATGDRIPDTDVQLLDRLKASGIRLTSVFLLLSELSPQIVRMNHLSGALLVHFSRMKGIIDDEFNRRALSDLAEDVGSLFQRGEPAQ
ncbi:hypothetical protein HKX48_005798 [Thoreauomyces humboldtii]|nr:hypothetical protein HKX48_005798 [Thoreauomyces humboldtii]